jgi:SAM-dependent methyltransferase
VEEYDGLQIGAPDASFDIVFSSNVLEHIRTLDLTLSEVRRVLRPGGIAIHILPTASWRLWTSLGHPAGLARGWLRGASTDSPASREPAGHPATTRPSPWKSVRNLLIPAPHGEYPSASSELWYFTRFRWKSYFAAHGWTVVQTFGNRLVYTGWGFFPAMPLGFRRVGALLLGSSTRTFVLAPD